MTGHFLALEHPPGRLALADGTRRAMRQRVAVRCILHAEIVALAHTAKALALGCAGCLDGQAALRRSSRSTGPGVRRARSLSVGSGAGTSGCRAARSTRPRRP